MIRTILLDLGNVLVHFSHERMCAQIGLLCGRTAAEIRRLIMDSGLQWDFERGRVSDAEFHRRAEDALGRRLDPHALHAAVCDIFEPNETMLALLPRLRDAGLRLVLLSNTSRWHYDWVGERFDVFENFDAEVLSCRVGEIKPHPAIYEAALEAIACEPRECFYTDDIPRYVEAARRHSLDAEVFCGAEAFVEQLAGRGVSLGVQPDVPGR